MIVKKKTAVCRANTEVYRMNVLGNVIMPIVAVILIVGVIMFMANKGSNRKDTHYDEMQLKIRATGYKL